MGPCESAASVILACICVSSQVTCVQTIVMVTTKISIFIDRPRNKWLYKMDPNIHVPLFQVLRVVYYNC